MVHSLLTDSFHLSDTLSIVFYILAYDVDRGLRTIDCLGYGGFARRFNLWRWLVIGLGVSWVHFILGFKHYTSYRHCDKCSFLTGIIVNDVNDNAFVGHINRGCKS